MNERGEPQEVSKEGIYASWNLYRPLRKFMKIVELVEDGG